MRLVFWNFFRSLSYNIKDRVHGPLTRYLKLRIAHAPVMRGTFSPSPRVSDPDMHHGTCVTDVSWCMLGSSTGGFLWSRWRGKRSRYSRRMRNPQFQVSGKRPISCTHVHFGNGPFNPTAEGYFMIQCYGTLLLFVLWWYLGQISLSRYLYMDTSESLLVIDCMFHR